MSRITLLMICFFIWAFTYLAYVKKPKYNISCKTGLTVCTCTAEASDKRIACVVEWKEKKR